MENFSETSYQEFYFKCVRGAQNVPNACIKIRIFICLIEKVSEIYPPNLQVNVRDTTAWTIGRVLEICPAIVNNAELRDSLLGAMSQGLGQEPRVATNVCWVRILFKIKQIENFELINFCGRVKN